jgi:hypothetical protein
MKSKDQQEWLLLVHQLPHKPTKLRVRIWRKLQTLGAISIKNSIYVLPFNEKTNEDFQWLKKDIESAGGESTVFRANAIKGATDKEIITLFRQSRNDEYISLASNLDIFFGTIQEQKRGGNFTALKIAQYENELTKHKQQLERINATDFFSAPKRLPVAKSFERCQKLLQDLQSTFKSKNKTAGALHKTNFDLANYQEKLWITRRNLHVDRLASGWLIKRFIDRRPRFRFVLEGEAPANGITFDMFEADFTHQGEDCTFETIIKRFGLDKDIALKQVAEIVHDIDLKDNKFNRSEAPGINAVIEGFAQLFNDNNERLKQTLPLFDGLYELFKSSLPKPKVAKPVKVKGDDKDDRG